MVTVDPVDYVEQAIAQAGTSTARLQAIRHELRARRRETHDALMLALIEEEDRDERDRLVDYGTFYAERLERADALLLDCCQRLVPAWAPRFF